MAEIILFQFENNEIRYVGDGTHHEWVAKDVCDAWDINNSRQALKRLDEDELGVCLTDTSAGTRSVATVNESGLYNLIIGSRKPSAKRFKRWITHEVLPSIRKKGAYSLNEDRESLEKQFEPTATIKEIKEAADLYDWAYGRSYTQGYIQQMLARHQPHLLGPAPAPEERASTKSQKALLTPTQLAEELGVLYKTGSPNPKAINKLLSDLGFQSRVDKQWQPTEKGQAHSDTKSVDTGSKTQRNQLFWFDSVVPILQEHTTKAR